MGNWRHRSLVRVAILLTFVLSLQPAGSAEEATRFFETDIRPLLVARCQKCHGKEARKGELRLDSRAAALAGGESGAAVVPGKPDESLLIEAVKHESFEMPPDGKLSDAEIDALTRWIEMGAPWPGSDDSSTPVVRKGPRELTDEDRSWWAFQPVTAPAIPEVKAGFALRNEVDRFIAARLTAEGLRMSPEADKRTLIRRATFNLHGLPPTPQDVEAFLADESPQAYEKLIDRLLDSPHYGERWGRYWLDLVRYAESDGYRQDAYRPTAWRYRDYVIASFASDKPYDRFIKEQLAGDEIAPDDSQALVATGYLQLGIYEYNQRDVTGQWNAILNEITDVTADVFLGQGLQCARCHDHKYDPLLQKDYYRLRAYFEAYSPQLETPIATPEERATYGKQLGVWEEKTATLRQELEALEKPIREAVILGESKKFPPEIMAAFHKQPEERTVQEHQLCNLAYRQIGTVVAKVDFTKKLQGDALEKWQTVKMQLAEFDAAKPKPLPTSLCGSDIGPTAPPTVIPGKRKAEAIEPGPLSVLDPRPTLLPTPSFNAKTTGRRSALADWIAHPNNPLTSRVMTNRIWQYHFGRGLVSTSSDFGHLGELPSHRELLDYLAHRFVESGWSIKTMHRLIMTSAAYRQSSTVTHVPEGVAKDPANRLLWRQNLRRLEGEQIPDAILFASGELDLTVGGPSVEVKLPRRTIYTQAYRNKRDPLLDVFDTPDGIASMPQRNVTTTPLQSLLMMNSPWMIERAKVLAASLNKQSSDDAATALLLYKRLFARLPSAEETATVIEFLREPTQRYSGNPAAAREQALTDLCHALLNSNGFLFVD